MRSALRALVSAFAYFTILPVGRWAGDGAPGAAAITALPVVGAVVGLIAGALAWACSLVAPQPWPALIAFAASLVLTGAIHVDGFLDSCDALLASVSVEKRMEILNDPRHGTYAVVGFVIIAMFWIAALLGIPPTMYPFALAFAGAAARLASVGNARIFPYASAGAMARSFEQRPSLALIIVLWIALEAAAYWFTQAYWPLAIAPCAIIVALIIGRLAANRLGGALNGDVYGATVVKIEVAILMAFALSATLRSSG